MEILKYKIDSFYLIGDFEEHRYYKNTILQLISTRPPSSFESIDNYYGDRVYKLDWKDSYDHSRDWVEIIKPKLEIALTAMARCAGYQKAIVNNIWFQQYVNGNTHGWHTHGNNFTGVYYLELPLDAPKTQLVNPFSQIDILEPNIQEGQIIIFPSYTIHRAPVITGQNLRKTIISFNLDFENIDENTLKGIN